MMATGEYGKRPMRAGQIVEVTSQFEDGSSTGPALGMVLRFGPREKEFYLKMVGAKNGFWSHWLLGRENAPHEHLIKLMQKEGERYKGKDNTEMIESWKNLADNVGTLVFDDVGWLPKAKHSSILKTLTSSRA